MGFNQQQRGFNPEKLGLKQQNWSLSYINYSTYINGIGPSNIGHIIDT